MARKSKPVKIKRYKNSMGSSGPSPAQIGKIAALVLGAVLVIALGYFLGKPVLNILSGAGGGHSQSGVRTSPASSQNPRDSLDAASDTADSSETEGENTQRPVTVKSRIYYYAPASSLTTEAGMDNVIRQMKEKGANCCVFDLKDPTGYVLFNSGNEYAKQLLSQTVIDLDMFVKKCSENGITPAARIYTFMDQMISTVERSTAVMYEGTDTRWLDSSAALGGKAWANPASRIMQDYIIALTDEILSHGVKEIIFAGFQTPTGYSLDKRDFGASQEQVLANMKSLITTLKSKISAKGGYSAWQFEYSAVVADGSYDQYIVHPYQLGADNIILTAAGADIDTEAAVNGLKNVSREDVSSITLWLTDGQNTEATKTMNNYFVF